MILTKYTSFKYIVVRQLVRLPLMAHVLLPLLTSGVERQVLYTLEDSECSLNRQTVNVTNPPFTLLDLPKSGSMGLISEVLNLTFLQHLPIH